MAAHRDPADTLFTDHLRALAAGREPDAEEIGRVLARLERLLARELRRRGIWRLPPRRLGVVGFRSWEEPEALAELAADAYEEALLRRLPGLARQLALKPDVEGLVKTNVKRFLRDLQRRGDPLGYRAWELALVAAERAVERGTLVVVAGGPAIDTGTWLAVGGEAAARAVSVAVAGDGDDDEAERPRAGGDDPGAEARRRTLAERAALWNAELLPELVTGRGRALAAVAERLAERLPELAAAGVEAFRVRELVAALRDDLRPRWLACQPDAGDEVAASEVRSAGEDEAPLPVLRFSSPAADPEASAAAREAGRRLVRCVEERLAELPGDERTRDEAYAVWRARLVAAAEEDERVSDRELSRRLGLPRDRVPRLTEVVRRAVDGCRRDLGLAAGEEEGR